VSYSEYWLYYRHPALYLSAGNNSRESPLLIHPSNNENLNTSLVHLNYESVISIYQQ